MPFSLKLEKVTYEGGTQDPTTHLVGALVEGEISGPEWVSLSLSDGSSALLKMIGMDVEGPFTHPDHRTIAGFVGNICLILAGHPERHSLINSGYATGIGKKKTKTSKRA